MQNYYGYYLTMAMMCALMLFLSVKKIVFLIPYAFELFLIANALTRCRTSGTMLSTVIAVITLLIIILVRFREKLLRFFTALALIVVTVIATAVRCWDLLGEIRKVFNESAVMVKNITNTADESEKAALNDIGSDRGGRWKAAIQLLKERPLTGVGPFNLGTRIADGGGAGTAIFNEYLNYAATLGLPALAFYLAAIVNTFVRGLIKLKSLSFKTVCLCVICEAYLISSFFGSPVYNVVPYFFMFFSLSVFSVERDIRKD